MSNYKIRVNSEVENKEVQGIFKILGGAWSEHVKADHYDKEFLYLTNGVIEYDDLLSEFLSVDACKEITLPELRDLVVLKRNDVGDASHESPIGTRFYVSSNSRIYYFNEKWCESHHIFNIGGLKLIEKKEMKEYLVKSQDGKWRLETDLVGDPSDEVIEIPKGSNIAVIENSKVRFYSEYRSADLDYLCQDIIWIRPSHPEELPFIDDEPKEYLREDANGSYILELTCKQEATEPHAKHWIEVPVGVNFYYSFASGDKVFTKEHSSLGRLLWQRKPPFSINDQYAEIETVRQTLNQRQEQYGSFEDVAMITEQMVDVMRKGYYENLAYNQKMALYMICSKMARIVNGNPNHKDSWHDIAGYATLIDNELVSEKDMPF